VRGQRALGVRRSEGCVAGAAEDVEKRVALRVDLVPAVRSERLPDQPVVRGLHVAVRLAELAHEASRAFDVREDEGNGASASLGHRTFSAQPTAIVNRRD
jgi:hypothetical protein